MVNWSWLKAARAEKAAAQKGWIAWTILGKAGKNQKQISVSVWGACPL